MFKPDKRDNRNVGTQKPSHLRHLALAANAGLHHHEISLTAAADCPDKHVNSVVKDLMQHGSLFAQHRSDQRSGSRFARTARHSDKATAGLGPDARGALDSQRAQGFQPELAHPRLDDFQCHACNPSLIVAQINA
ncbi:MAG: hypothetical protein U5K36_15985 [Roseovarius sp.]|nr:hypothetical protein [Roseovarius sp.]